MPDPRARLAAGTAALGVAVDAIASERLLALAELLARWNRVYNLTAAAGTEAIVTRHLLDSLTVQPHLRGPRVADVGTGAGLPGLPLAIVDPGRNFTLLDANAKRIRFVRQAVIELGLDNVEAVQARVEAYRPAVPFDVVLTRAFAGLSDMLLSCRHLVAAGGQLLAMKGPRATDELDSLPDGFRLLEKIDLEVPGLAATRTLLRLVPDTARPHGPPS